MRCSRSETLQTVNMMLDLRNAANSSQIERPGILAGGPIPLRVGRNTEHEYKEKLEGPPERGTPSQCFNADITLRSSWSLVAHMSWHWKASGSFPAFP